jgi:hypothetical protein
MMLSVTMEMCISIHIGFHQPKFAPQLADFE